MYVSCKCGADGSLRLVVPRYGFAEFVDIAVQEVWRLIEAAKADAASLTAFEIGLFG